jgi:hypothetical protein
VNNLLLADNTDDGIDEVIQEINKDIEVKVISKPS